MSSTITQTPVATTTETGRSPRPADLVFACERERQRLARAVHDSLGQLVAAATITTDRLRSAMPDDTPALFQRLSGLLGDLSAAVRRLESGLHPPLLAHFGGVAALQAWLRETGAATGIRCTLACPAEESLPATVGGAAALFRIAETLIVEQAGRAQPESIEVTIMPQAAGVLLSVVFLGTAGAARVPPPDAEPPLLSFADWVGAVGASVATDRATAGRMHVEVTIPSSTGAVAR